MTATMRPHRVDFPESDLEDLRHRLAATRWPADAPEPGWSRGVPPEYLRELAEYWRTGFDWRAVEAKLNRFPQFVTEVDGSTVHLVHARSPEPDAVPVLVTHGWPGSVLEFLHVVGPLTDPAAYGAAGEQAFEVVLPTVPGFGLSGPARDTGWDAVRVGRAWAEIMRRLGHERYLVQGGDLGSSVSLATAAVDPEHVAGVHLNFLVTPPSGPEDLDGLTDRDTARLGRLQDFLERGSGYMHLMATRPRTLSYALTDSPAGQLAWAAEKYVEWSGGADRPEEAIAIARDDILANVSLTWLTATAGSSAEFYREMAPLLLPGSGTPPPPPPAVPLGVSVYPSDPAPPVRALAERVHPDVVLWREHPAGGHFPALERPDDFVADLREFARIVDRRVVTGASGSAR